MKKLFTAFCIATTLISQAANPVLRFKQFTQRQPDGLVRNNARRSMTPSAPLKVSTEGMPELVANCILSNPGYGMYSFKATEGISINKLSTTPAFEGGAVYVNGKYYACSYDYDSSHTLTMMKWYTYDALTWTLLSELDNPLDFSYIATDRTYDQSTGKVYSISYDKTGQSIWLSTTDVKTGAPTMIAPLQKDVITIAASKKGELYGIDTNANLYKINPADASLTLIGNTGIFEDYQSDYTQSITFDTRTDKLYWAEFHTSGWFDAASALYEVDIKTGKAAKIADIPGNPELVGLYVNRYASAGVPDEVSGLTAIPRNDEATKFVFSFTAPTLSVEGNTLDADTPLEVEISVDGDLIDLVNLKPGATATTSEHTFTTGRHSLRVTASNSVGQGVTSGLSFHAGYDVPAAVSDLRLSVSGMTTSLSWAAPSKGANGGTLRSPITYNVTRMPGNIAVASGLSTTSFSETIEQPALCHYVVTAISPDGAGPAAESNKVVAALFNAPYECGFDTEAEFNLFTIANFSESIKVWNYDENNKCARHSWDISYDTDDWLISPAIKLDLAYTYEVSFDAWQMVESYPDHFELWYGSSSDPQHMTRLLDTGKLPATAKQFAALVSPLADGEHYFAIRGNNPRNGMMSYADNIRVTPKGSSNVPAPPSNLSLSAADGGLTEVTVELDAPSKMMNGSALSSITSIDIIRGAGDEPVKSFLNPAPGSHLKWTDTSVTTGVSTYRAIVRSQQGTSQPVSASVFAGIDVPTAPVDVEVQPLENGFHISWTAPAQGANGGNLKGLLSYRVQRVANNEAETVESATTDISLIDDWTPVDQASAYYTITALTEAGESESAASEKFEVGKAYALPYTESFAEGVTQTNPWTVQNVIGSNGNWALFKNGENPYVKAHDDDNGLATFDGYHAWTDGMELRLISPRIDLSKFVDPVLTFHMYHYNGSAGWWQEEPDPVNEWLQVEISADNTNFQTLPSAKFESYAATSAWQKHTIALNDYNTLSEARIAFRGHGAGCANIHIDDIEIKGTIEQSSITEIQNVGFISVEGKHIIFRDLTAPLCIYDVSGMLVARRDASCGSVSLPSGIYIARSGSQYLRFAVR